MMYAARAQPRNRVSTVQTSSSSTKADKETLHCTFCNKTGHTATKCWNKPPYYCPRCKIQGHNLQTCTVKGKKNTNPEDHKFKGEGKPARQTGKKNEKEEERTLMVRTPVKYSRVTTVKALYGETTDQAFKNKVEQENSILDSGATSHMTPHAHYFCEIHRPSTSKMVMTGAKEMLQVTGIGCIRGKTSSGQVIVMHNVLLVPKLAASLMSLAKILQ